MSLTEPCAAPPGMHTESLLVTFAARFRSIRVLEYRVRITRGSRAPCRTPVAARREYSSHRCGAIWNSPQRLSRRYTDVEDAVCDGCQRSAAVGFCRTAEFDVLRQQFIE